MSEKITKKVELSKSIIASFEQAKEKLFAAGVEGYSLGEYIDFLHSSVSTDDLIEHLESKIPLKARLLSAIETGNEELLLDMQRLLEKQNRTKPRKPIVKESIEV